MADTANPTDDKQPIDKDNQQAINSAANADNPQSAANNHQKINDALLDPAVSPLTNQKELLKQFNGKYLNKKGLYIFGGFILVFLFFMMWGVNKNSQNNVLKAYQNKQAASSKQHAQNVMQAGVKSSNIAKIAAKKHQAHIDAVKAQQAKELKQQQQQKLLGVINQLAKELEGVTDEQEIAKILAKYGITDPELVKQITQRIKNGDNLDEILAEALKQQPFTDLTNADIQHQILERVKNGEDLATVLDDLGIVDAALKEEILRRVAAGEKLEDVLADINHRENIDAYLASLGITDPKVIAQIKDKLAKGEKIADILTDLNLANTDLANLATKTFTLNDKIIYQPDQFDTDQNRNLQNEISKRTKDGAKLEDVLADIETRQQLAAQIAQKLAGGEDITDLLAEYGITDPKDIAEIKRRILNGEPIDQILADIAKNNPDSKLAKLYGIKDIPNRPNSSNSSNNANVPAVPTISPEELAERKAMRDAMRQRKMQLFEQALTAKMKIDFQAESISADIGSSSAVPSMLPNDDDKLAKVRAQISAQQQEAKQAEQLLEQAKQLQEQIANDSSGFMPMSSIDNDDISSSNYPNLANANYSSNIGNNEGSFVKANNPSDRWSLNQEVQPAASKFVIQPGTVIPATLIGGINSDLPGQIVAQVSQNVYDSPTGRYVLIPQGSKLVGEFASGVMFGQERVLVSWQLIVFADGKTLDIGEMAGTDAAGFSGFKDQLNNHYWKTFGNAFLMGGVITTITISQDKGNKDSNNQRASDALSEALGQQIGQVATQMIQKNMNVSPTIEIRPGYRFNVSVSKNLIFPPDAAKPIY